MFTTDIGDMYLQSSLDEPEYVKFNLDYYKQLYKTKAKNGYVIIVIKKLWYGINT